MIFFHFDLLSVYTQREISFLFTDSSDRGSLHVHLLVSLICGMHVGRYGRGAGEWGGVRERVSVYTHTYVDACPVSAQVYICSIE